MFPNTAKLNSPYSFRCCVLRGDRHLIIAGWQRNACRSHQHFVGVTIVDLFKDSLAVYRLDNAFRLFAYGIGQKHYFLLRLTSSHRRKENS